jgi:hypothetical protein
MPPILLSELAAHWRVLAYGLLVVAVFTSGYIRGLERGDARLAAYQLAVQQAADKQTNHTIAVVAAQKSSLQEVANDYQGRMDTLTAFYTDRLQHAAPGGSTMSGVPAVPGKADGLSTNGLPVAAGQPTEPLCSSEYHQLELISAHTTLQLEELQDAIRKQSVINPGPAPAPS